MNGTSTLKIEVSHISQHGIWLLSTSGEHFLPYESFPWFKNAKVCEIHNVVLESKTHLYWPDLDIDLSLEIIDSPDKFSLIAKC